CSGSRCPWPTPPQKKISPPLPPPAAPAPPTPRLAPPRPAHLRFCNLALKPAVAENTRVAQSDRKPGEFAYFLQRAQVHDIVQQRKLRGNCPFRETRSSARNAAATNFDLAPIDINRHIAKLVYCFLAVRMNEQKV